MYSILIVDDEPIVKIALRSIHTLGGAWLFYLRNGIKWTRGTALIEQHHPDVIITDLKMPGMDGLE